MNKYKLSDLCISITDGEHGSIKDSPNSNFYLLNNNNITQSGIKINANDRHISEADFKKIHKRTNLQKGDLVIATCGTLGKTVIINDNIINYEFSRSVGIIKCDLNKLIPNYLHYYFQSPSTQYRIKNIAKGGVQKHFYINDMADFEIYLPDLPTQKKIADVLSCIDDKIALNNKTNTELENMAKTIYDYWFTQFDFPDKNGHPYKTSGGQMVYNEILKREIPAGWNIGKLSSLINVITERINSKDVTTDCYTPIEIIPRKRMSFFETSPMENASTGLCTYLKKDILLSNRRVYFHKVSIASFDGVTRDTVIILRPKNLNNLGYVFFTVFSDCFIQYATKNSYGSEQPVLSTPTVLDYNILLPNQEIDLMFSKRIQPIIDQVLKNQLENKQLTKLRDYLLPLLMNGQIEVN